MSREPKTKLCRCGQGKIMTGRHSVYNGKDSQGRQVCSQCVIDNILAPYIKKE